MSRLKSFNEWLQSQVSYNTYSESIANLPEHSRDFLLREAPHTRIKDVPDARLNFLCGAFVDLGFENLGLSQPDQAALYQAFSGNGVGIPGTGYKLRYHGLMGYTLIEPSQGGEPELPLHWRQAVLVVNDQDEFTWIGKQVRPDQIGHVDLNLYRDVGDGWELAAK